VIVRIFRRRNKHGVKPMSVIDAPNEPSVKEAEKAAEPPSSLRPLIFTIGRDSIGNWVAQEKSGTCGGLFTDRAGALKFVKFETGNHPYAVVWVNGVHELNTVAAVVKPSENTVGSLQRVRYVA
jgi:hypothetical protein